MFCPECGTQIKDGSKFCIKCGHRIEGDIKEETQVKNEKVTSISETPQKISGDKEFKKVGFILCPHCKKENSEGSFTCSKCGNVIDRNIKKETTIEKETSIKRDKPNQNEEKYVFDDEYRKTSKNTKLLILGLVLLMGLIIYGMIPESNNSKQSVETNVSQFTPSTPSDPLQVLYETPPSDLQPDGELNEIFDLPSDYTDVQRENKEREIKGKIVQWNLRVYEVHREGDKYRITTGESDRVGTVLHISGDSAESGR